MYKATVRALIRHGLRKLNEGDASFLFRLAHPDAVLMFPGDNSWAAMYRPVVRGLDAHATHRGTTELQGFVDRFTEVGIQFLVDDILVNGGPWRTRVAIQGRTRLPDPDGGPDRYQNRVVSVQTIVWGRMVAWEDYEDTQRAADLDERLAADAALVTAQ